MKYLTILFFSFLVLSTVLMTNCGGLLGGQIDSIYYDYDMQALGYNLAEPTDKFFLNYDLEEISGIAALNDEYVAAVQDENGILYILNPQNGQIVREIRFKGSGDYEGVEIIQDQVYIIESGGDLFNFKLKPDLEKVKVTTIKTGLTSKNDVEGMASFQNSLILACKGSGDSPDNKVKGKAVYKFDPKEKKLGPKEMISIHKDELQKFVEKRNYFNKVHDFDPSAIAFHPITGDIYILSADRYMVVFSPDFVLKEVVKLEPIIYRQPEGICFFSDGTLYISTEGDGAKGKLMRLKYNN